MLVTDAFGGYGGIALYNRDLAEAIAQMPEVTEVVVLPRVARFEPEAIPPKVRNVPSALGGKVRYARTAWALAGEGFDLLVCGHINLLPLATALKLRLRAPMALMVHGIDVWTPPRWSARRCIRAVDVVWSVSEVTRARMNHWAQLNESRYTLMRNAIHLERYGAGPKPEYLLDRYKLHGATVLLTLARLPSRERYKGVDEMLRLLPALVATDPSTRYVVAGDGDDRARLEEKAKDLGVSDTVIFTGMIEEREKADHFRVADVFVMPGRGEGFGFVFLEAMACGIPVVGSRLDGSREALRDGMLGALVDPTNPRSIEHGIAEARARGRGVPDGLSYFAWPTFCDRVADAVRTATAPKATQA
jgi:glycosyltransferase involved in cell wall biosynthesis